MGMGEKVGFGKVLWEGLSLPFHLNSQAETRAEFAERSVAKLEKTIDDLEGKRDTHPHPITISMSLVFSFHCICHP
jgi:hypothetical protein